MKPLLLLVPLLLVSCTYVHVRRPRPEAPPPAAPTIDGPLPDHWSAALRRASEHFRLETDVSPADADDLLARLERIYPGHRKRFGYDPVERSGAPLRVLAFRRPADFGRYTGQGGFSGLPAAGSVAAARFGSHPEDPKLRVIALTFARADLLEANLRHELAHFFIHHRGIPLSRFAEEGLAEYLGRMGVSDPAGEAAFERAMERGAFRVATERLLAASSEEFRSYDGRPEEFVRERAWALVVVLIERRKGVTLSDYTGLDDRIRDLAADVPLKELWKEARAASTGPRQRD